MAGRGCETNGEDRLKIQELVTNFFKKTILEWPQSWLATIYLCLNRVGPAHEGLELGIGTTLLIKTLAQATAKTTDSLKKEMEKIGDLGKVAAKFKLVQKAFFVGRMVNKLSVQQVFEQLRQIAQISGEASMQRKMTKIHSLLVQCEALEAKYLIKSLEGKLRIGLAEQTVLISMAHACADIWPPPSGGREYAVTLLKSAYYQRPVYEDLVKRLLEKQNIDEALKDCTLLPGIPIKPMLAQPSKSLQSLTQLEQHQLTYEYKYDGERAQIHGWDDQLRVYSRNLENMSGKYPDLALQFPAAKSFVLDCEVVAWDLVNKRVLPFQVLSTRKRKTTASEETTVKVCLFAFDLLYLDGESLLKHSLAERRRLLFAHFPPIPDRFQWAKYLNPQGTAAMEDEVSAFLEESIAEQCEGLMVKTLDGTYEPSKRSRHWLKVKKDYLMGMGDSLDLVVMGAYYGKGKRTGVYGGFLMACYDPHLESFETICKLGTGFSDADLKLFHEQLRPSSSFATLEKKPLGADVWFEPTQVWEVKAADFSLSPVYEAARGRVGGGDRGVSLRFPRFLRVRPDKKPEDATTSDQIARLYRSQANVVATVEDEEEEYY